VATGVIVDIRERDATTIVEYARISAGFEVREMFDCIDDPAVPGGVGLTLTQLENSYIKDYDIIPGEHPESWPSRFAGSRWSLFLADVHGQHVGGAVVVLERDATPARTTLWDIRVAAHLRRAGVGTALFRRAEGWALDNGSRFLDVETQNINVAACQFYQRQGCSLHAVNREAYLAFPDEVQLIWRKEL